VILIGIVRFKINGDVGSLGSDPIAVRLRQTLSGARSQALPGNVFLAALPPVQFVGGRATSENVPRQSLGTSTGASLI